MSSNLFRMFRPTSRQQNRPRPRQRGRRLWVENLEDRVLLSGFAASLAGDDMVALGSAYTVQLRTTQPTPNPWLINWGDGNTSSVAGSAISASHSYAGTGNYGISASIQDPNGVTANAFLDYAQAVLADSPAAYFRLDESTGTTAANQVAGSPNGSYVGTVSLGNAAASASLGNALGLSGAGYVSVPASLVQSSNDFSMECWLAANNLSSTQTLYAGVGTAAGTPHVFLANNALNFELVGSGVVSCNIGSLIGLGQWHQVALSYDHTANEVRFYVDGLVQSITSFTGSPGAISTAGGAVGAWDQGGGTVTQFLNGQLDEVAVYGNVLSAARVRDHYNDALTAGANQWVTVGVSGAQAFSIDQPVTTTTVLVQLDPSPTADNGPTIRTALSRAGSGTLLRLVDKNTGLGGGTYYVRTSAFVGGGKNFLAIVNKTDLVLDGNGVTLVLTQQGGTYLDVSGSTRVRVTNLAFDVDPSFYRVAFYAKLLSVNPSTGAVVAQALTGSTMSPDPSVPSGMIFSQWEPTDPVTLQKDVGPVFDNGTQLPPTITNSQYASAPTRDGTDPSVWHLSLRNVATDPFWAQLQAYLAGSDFYRVNCYNPSKFTGASVTTSTQLSFDGLRFYALPGNGFLASEVDHIQVVNSQIGLPPGLTVADRPLAGASDGFHFHNTHGYILFQNNDVGQVDDDPISIKDANSTGLTLVNSTTLTVSNAGSTFHVGDPVELRNPDLSPAGYQSTVTAVSTNATSGLVTLTFQDPLPATVNSGAVLFNHYYNTSNWIVRGNYFHDLNGQLMLYAPNGTVEQNRFSPALRRLHLGTSSISYENAGYGVSNLLVRDNIFRGSGADMIALLTGNVITSYPIFQDILFKDDSFLDTPQQPFFISSATRVSLSDNYIENSNAILNGQNPGTFQHGGVIQMVSASSCWIGNNLRNQWLPSADTDIRQFQIVSDGTPYTAVNNTVVPRSWPLQTGWTSQDIGAVGASGDMLYVNGTYVARGSGADIGGTADAFQFAYQTLTGDGAIVARVASVQNTNPWAKVGVMIRETTSAGSANALMELTAGNGLAFQYRATGGGSTTLIPGAAVGFPYWVELARSGNTFTGYASPDGVTWTLVGSVTLNMASSVLVGLAISSHVNSTLCYGLLDNVSVSPPQGVNLAFGQQPGTTTAGQAVVPAPTVSVRDQNGNIIDSQASITVVVVNSAGAPVAGPFTVQAVHGVATFSQVVTYQAGTGFRLVASSGNLLPATSSLFNVNATTAVSLVVSGYPLSPTAGTARNFTVTARDTYGNIATGYSGTVHFSSTDSQAVLPADAVLVNGSGTFSATFKTAGSQSLTATDTVNSTLTSTQSGITVKAAAAASFVVSGYTSPTTAGMAQSFSVTARDAYGNLATTYSGTVHFSSSDTQAVLPANATLSGGTGSFSATLKTAGSQSLTAADTVNGALTGTQSGISVTPAAVAALVVSGYVSPTTAGTAHTFTVTGRDAYGNIATSYSGTVHFSSSDAQAVLPPDTPLSNGTGSFSATFTTAGMQSITATDSANATLTGMQSGISVTPAAAVTLVVSGYVSPTTAGTAQSFTVTVYDAYGNLATGYHGTIHFSSTDSQAVLPANATLAGGTGTFSATLKTAGSQSLTATDTVNGALTGTLSGISVTPAAVAALTVSGYTSPTTAGTAHTFTVTARDAYGNLTPSYSGTVHFSSTDSQATLPSDAALSGGTGSFSATFKTAGSQSLTATDTVNAAFTATQSGISVTPAAAVVLAVSGYTSPATAGTAHIFTATARDAYGNIATGYSGTLHFTSSDAQAVLPANATLTAGTGSFSATFKTAGSQSLTATDTVNAAFTATQSGISVTPAAAASFVVSGYTSPTTAGTAQSFSVTARDAYGNLTTSYSGTVHFSSSDTQSVLPANATLSNGTGTFSATLKTAGSQSLTATDTVNGALTGTESGISVTPAAVAALVVSGYVSPTTAGTAHTFTVTARDAYGNIATGYSGTVHFTSSDPQAVLPADTPLSGGTGTFSATFKTAGSQSLTATDTVNSALTGTQSGITVSAATASLVVSGYVSSTTAGTVHTFTVTARDAYGNIATGYSGTVHFSSSDAQAVLPANATLSNGTGTFSATFKTAGSQSLTATDTVNGALTGTQSGISVTSAAATQFVLAGPSSITSGSAFSITVEAVDAYGNIDTNYRGTVTLTSARSQDTLPPNHTFTGSDAGVFTFTGIVAGHKGSDSFTVTDTVNTAITASLTYVVH
jgi:hypothetical protein